jgi:DNA-directed RNA polymerase specialized sigma24 family protein
VENGRKHSRLRPGTSVAEDNQGDPASAQQIRGDNLSNQTVEELAQLIEQKRDALAAIAAAMHADGDSLRTIGQKMGVSHELVRRWIQRARAEQNHVND